MCDDVKAKTCKWGASLCTCVNSGAKISYAVDLVMAVGGGGGACVLLLWCQNIFIVAHWLVWLCHWGSWHKKHRPHVLFRHVLCFFLLVYFSAAKKNKTNKMTHCRQSTCLCIDRSLQYYFFCQYSWEYANEGASHSIVEWVMWPEQRGLRARGVGEAPAPQMRGGSPPAPICCEREPLFA